MIAIFILFITIFLIILWASIPPKMNQESSDDYSIHIFDSFISEQERNETLDQIKQMKEEYTRNELIIQKQRKIGLKQSELRKKKWRYNNV